MVIEYIRYNISEAKQAEFIDAYHAASAHLLQSEYCQSYDICQCVEDASQFVIRIKWSSAEDHLQKFRSSAEFKAFFKHIRQYVDDIVEMRHYRQLNSH